VAVFALFSVFIFQFLASIPPWVYTLLFLSVGVCGLLFLFRRKVLTMLLNARMRVQERRANTLEEEHTDEMHVTTPVVQLPEPQLHLLSQGSLPVSALLPRLFVLEEYGMNEQPVRSTLLRCLLEEIAIKRLLTSILITSNQSYVSLCREYPNCRLVGHPSSAGLLPQELHTQFLPVSDSYEAQEFGQRILHGDNHLYVLLLPTYPDEGYAAQMLFGILDALSVQLRGNSSPATKHCLLLVDDAHRLVVTEELLGQGLFTNIQTATLLRQQFLSLLSAEDMPGLHAVFAAKELFSVDTQVLSLFRRWFINKIPDQIESRDGTNVSDELRLLCSYLGLNAGNFEDLWEGAGVLVSALQTSERIRLDPLLLRPHHTLHAEMLRPFRWGTPRQSTSAARRMEGMIGDESATKASPLPSLTPTQEALVRFLCYVRVYKNSLYSAPMLVSPPQPLFALLNELGLHQLMTAQGQLFGSEENARGFMAWINRQSEGYITGTASTTRARLQQYWARNQRKTDALVQPSQAGTSSIPKQASPSPPEKTEKEAIPLSPTSQTDTIRQEPLFEERQRQTLGDTSTWKLPQTTLLNLAEVAYHIAQEDEAAALASTAQRALGSFGVDAEVKKEDISIGPTIIRLGIRPTGKPEMKPDEKTGKLVPVRDAAGNIVYETRTRVSRIMALQNDLALVLEAKTIRMEAPVPGRPYVGVEIPNKNSRLVTLREVLESKEYQPAKAKSKLAVVLGRDVAGMIRFGDIARMPHLLIAGSTGSGKSVMINAIIASIITQATPDDVRLLMVDPKMVELNMYNGIPHLLSPVVTEVEKVVSLLKNGLSEMEKRYRLFSQLGVRNLDGYRKMRAERMAKGDNSFANLPAIVIIIDELADLMMTAPEEVEGMICRLAQLARATGIHLVVATQRPSVDVITGLIKANIPTRISFMVSSAVDSRTIIDMGGAECLLGRGDMLYLPSDAGRPERIQGSFLADEEAERLVQYWREQATQHAMVANGGQPVDPTEVQARVEPGWELKEQDSEDFELDDDLLDKAEEVVREYEKASISLLQRRLKIGYSRAARLIDLLEERGIIGRSEQSGRGGREILGGSKGEGHTMADEKENALHVSEQSSSTAISSHANQQEKEEAASQPLVSEEANRLEQDTQPSMTDKVGDERSPTTGPLECVPQLPAEEAEGPLAALVVFPLLLSIAQGNLDALNGKPVQGADALLLVIAAIALRMGEVSPNKVISAMSVKDTRVYNAVDDLTQKHHLLLPHTGGKAPRQLTSDRGGEQLGDDLSALRTLIDRYKQVPLHVSHSS